MPFDKIIFRLHSVRRMLQRNISEDAVKQALKSGKLVENYPQDKPYPSYLLLHWSSHDPLHVVAADNVTDQETIVITVYEPDLEHWDSSFERRKK